MLAAEGTVAEQTVQFVGYDVKRYVAKCCFVLGTGKPCRTVGYVDRTV